MHVAWRDVSPSPRTHIAQDATMRPPCAEQLCARSVGLACLAEHESRSRRAACGCQGRIDAGGGNASALHPRETCGQRPRPMVKRQLILLPILGRRCFRNLDAMLRPRERVHYRRGGCRSMARREGRQARCLLAWRLRAPPWLRHPIPGWRALARLRRHAGAPLTKRLCVLGAARLFCGLSRQLRRAWRASAGASRRAGHRPRDGADARGGRRPCDKDNDSGLNRRRLRGGATGHGGHRPCYGRFPHGRRRQERTANRYCSVAWAGPSGVAWAGPCGRATLPWPGLGPAGVRRGAGR